MALTPQILSPQGGVLAAFSDPATLQIPQANVVVTYNIPAVSIKSTALSADAVYSKIAGGMPVTQAAVIMVGRGTIGTPRLKSWAFTLDGHDFYVLKLGTSGKTLVFDLTTQQWAWWATKDRVTWRASVGLNWRSSDAVPSNYGSNVIVGDDSVGVLWVLDPSYGLDDNVTGDPSTFDRVATAQMITRDRNYLPVYAVDLVGDYGLPALADNTVTLEYSDDSGHTFSLASDPIVIQDGGYTQSYTWRSLGMVGNPGRIFKITDDGSFARIDSLYVNE